MKPVFWFLFFAWVAGVDSLFAVPVVTIERQATYLGIQGGVWGIKENMGQSYSGTAVGGGVLSGEANWTVITPVVEATLPLELHAQSTASMTSQVSSSLFSSVGVLTADTWMNVGFPFAQLMASAWSVFEVEFRVAVDTAFAVDIHHSADHGGGGNPDFHYELPWFTLSRIGGPELIATQGSFISPSEYGYTGTGTLTPGSYRVSYLANASVAGDPLGEFSHVRYDMSLAFLSRTDQGASAVPDTGAYAWGLALVGWWMMGRRPPRCGAGGMTNEPALRAGMTNDE